MNLDKIQIIHDEFCKLRGWEKFHLPKNLIMALTGEVGELNEIFQWLDHKECIELMQDDKKRTEVEEELADIMIYLSRLCFLLGVDLERACLDKFQKNALKYPVHLSKGNSLKYTDFRAQGEEF